MGCLAPFVSRHWQECRASNMWKYAIRLFLCANVRARVCECVCVWDGTDAYISMLVCWFTFFFIMADCASSCHANFNKKINKNCNIKHVNATGSTQGSAQVNGSAECQCNCQLSCTNPCLGNRECKRTSTSRQRQLLHHLLLLPLLLLLLANAAAELEDERSRDGSSTTVARGLLEVG